MAAGAASHRCWSSHVRCHWLSRRPPTPTLWNIRTRFLSLCSSSARISVRVRFSRPYLICLVSIFGTFTCYLFFNKLLIDGKTLCSSSSRSVGDAEKKDLMKENLVARFSSQGDR